MLENNTIRVALGAGVILLVAFLITGYVTGGILPKAPADLSLSIAQTQQGYFAGEAAAFNVTVMNLGGTNADGVVLQLSSDGRVLAQKTVSVPANSNTTTAITWVSRDAGNHDVSFKINAGNMVQESDYTNNNFGLSLIVAPNANSDLFSELPDANISQAYYFNATARGLNQLIGILSQDSSTGTLFASMLNQIDNAQLGFLDYSDGSEAAELVAQTELTRDEFAQAAVAIGASNASVETEMVGNIPVRFFETSDGYYSFCVFNGNGFGKVLMYKKYMLPANVFGNFIGDNSTCLDIVGKSYNASNARNILATASILAGKADLPNTTTLLEGLTRSGIQKLYARGFSDDNSAYLLMISDNGAAFEQNCTGDLIQFENTSICHADQATLMSTVTLEAYMRKQAQYTVLLFVVPFSSTNLTLARSNAQSLISSVVFPGASEYVWGSKVNGLAICDFDNTLYCTKPSFSNNTYSFNLSSANGQDYNLTGLRCTQANETFTNSITPVLIPANGSALVSVPCYEQGNVTTSGLQTYLQANLIANISSGNESRLINGEFVITGLNIQLPSSS